MKKFFGQNLAFGVLLIAAAIFVRSAFLPSADYKASLVALVDEAGQSISTTVASSNRSVSLTDSKPKVVQAIAPRPKPDYPAKLLIPSIDVDASVQDVGLNSKGNIGTPSNFREAAWYTGSALPGNLGTALIDGHVDNALALPGVFKHLNEVKVGDDIYVVRNDGRKLHFQVTAIQSYPYDSAPLETILKSSDNKSHLNLITCIGDWDSENHTYNERLVVYSTLVDNS